MVVIKPLDFVVIGAAKSGTTSLFHYLRYHPQIFLPTSKEAPFFSEEEVYRCGWEHFVQNYFSEAAPSLFWGKITPRYMLNPLVPERLAVKMPTVKLIALLRNPIDRAFSFHRMAVRRGKSHQSFEESALRALDEKTLERARAIPLPDEETNIVGSEYGRILEQFLSFFKEEKLLVLFTDELEKHPYFVLDKIYSFLDLESSYVPPNLGKKYFVGGSRQRFSWLIPSLKNTPIKRLWRFIPKSQRRSIFFWYRTQVNVVSEPPPALSSAFRQELVNFYQADVKKLESLIGNKIPWTEFQN